jgi:uncharacterized glyoxalase superfamily protein PhnB
MTTLFEAQAKQKTKQAKPAESPWLVPYLIVKDSDESLDFYTRAFGFEKKMAMPGPDGKTMHAEMTYKDVMIMFSPEGSYGNPYKCPATSGTKSPMSLYLYTDDVDAFFKRAVAAGAKVEKEPADQFWGDRTCCLIDPNGFLWSFGTHTGKTWEFKPGEHCSG